MPQAVAISKHLDENVPNSPAATRRRRRGRPAAASRDDVLRAAMRHYLSGERVDVQAIAAQLGLGRTTVYRWFGSREQLIGEVLLRAALPLLDRAHHKARGRGGALLLDTFDRFNRRLAESSSLRRFVDQERETALRIMTRSDGPVQPRIVAAIEELIQNETRAGTRAARRAEHARLRDCATRRGVPLQRRRRGHPRRRRPAARRRGRTARRRASER